MLDAAANPVTRTTLESLEPYVPLIVRERLARDPSPLTEPLIEHFSAAVLFADISGFTALTEELARRGAAGAEQLKGLLDTCFGKLVELVNAHGGDVIKFPGDGALVLWRVRQGEVLAYAARLAAKCGLVIHKYLDQPAEIEGVRLRMRIAITAGAAFAASVGGAQGRWELVVGGDAVGQIASTLKEAQPGEVACSPSAWALLDASTAKATRNGFRILKEIDPGAPPAIVDPPRLTAEAEAALRQYIPRTIQTRIDAGQADWLAEFRYVTVLFVNAHQPALMQAGGAEGLHSVARALQEAVSHFGGGVNELLVDDKGFSLVAGWGQSLSTHDDDAARACQAALEAQQALGKMGVASGAGIATGRAFVGTRGGPSRAEYAIIGDIVNVAARLMSAASNTILCDAATRSRARRQMVFESLTPLRIKGKAEPVPVFRPLGHKRRLAPGRQPMFGRPQEQLQLRQRLDALALRGEGGVVFICGDAGIGKSCMVANLLEQTQLLTVRSIVGSGEDLERSAVYHAWRGIFSSLLGLDHLDAGARGSRVRELLASEQRHWEAVPLLNSVLALDLPEIETTVGLAGEARAGRTRDLLVELLRKALRESPTLIVLEDAHWLDSASWALAEAIHRAIPGLLLVITTRPLSTEQTPPEMRRLFDEPETVKVALKTLEPEEALELLSHRIDADLLPESVARLIQAKSEGNPFFIEQLAAAMRDKGVIRVSDGECILTGDPSDLSSTRFPETIQAVIRGRIDCLTTEQQLTLKVASVLGPVSHLQELEQIHPLHLDVATLKRQLDVAIELDLMRSMEDKNSYSFKHAITQEVAYSMLSFAQRRQLHRAVADWLEGRHAAKISEIYPLLAHHWAEAEDTAKALEYLEKAGEAALAAFANREAVNFFSRAIALAGAMTGDQRGEGLNFRCAHWHRQAATGFVEIGDLGSSLNEARRCLELLGCPIPQSKAGKVWLMFRHAVAQAAHLTFSGRFVEKDPHRQRLLAEAAEAGSRVAFVSTMKQDILESMAASLASVNWAQNAAQQSIFPLAIVGYSLGALKMARLSRMYFELARSNALAMRRFHELGLASSIECVISIGRAQFDHCAAIVTDTLPIMQSTGDRLFAAELTLHMGCVASFQGHFSEARERSSLALELAGDGNSQSKPYSLYIRALAQYMLLKPQEARLAIEEHSRKAKEIAAQHDRLVPMFFGSLEGCAYWHLNEWEKARIAATDATSYLGTALLPPPWSPQFILETYIGLWEHWSQKDSNAAVKMERSALRVARFYRLHARIYPVHQPRYLHLKGQIAWLRGNRSKAMKAWRSGLALAGKLGLSFDEGLCHYEIARRNFPDLPAGSSHLEKAREIFTLCKTPYYLDKVETLRTISEDGRNP